jgi:integrase
VYSFGRKPRWYRIGPAAMGAALAKIRAKVLTGEVALGKDPQAEKMAKNRDRGGLTFEQLHERYVEEWAKKRNKSWAQADKLIRTNVLKNWGERRAAEITRADVKQLFGSISTDRPVLANQVKHAVSAVFKFAIDEEVVAVNPCKGVKDNPTSTRERTLADVEVQLFFAALAGVDPLRAAALKVVLLTGQRPGEVCHMRREHVKGRWWEMPGKPVSDLSWPGTKNKQDHRVWLSAPVMELIGTGTAGFVFASERGRRVDNLDAAMREISTAKNLNPAVTPHDLRRTLGTTITARGHGRDAMDRILNHRKKAVTDVYDRHDYAKADEAIMEDVAAAIMRLAEGRQEDNVAEFRKAKA